MDEKAKAAEVSETDTEKQLVIGLPENRDRWNNREWGIYTVRSLMYHVDIMDMEDVAELQGVLIRLGERARGEAPKQQSQGEQLPGQMSIEDMEGVAENEQTAEKEGV